MIFHNYIIHSTFGMKKKKLKLFTWWPRNLSLQKKGSHFLNIVILEEQQWSFVFAYINVEAI